MIKEFRNYRNALVEKVAETDEELIIKYLEDGEISKEEIKRALRRATLDYKMVPVLCGTALRHRGIQPLLDSVGDYLPSPLDVPPHRAKHSPPENPSPGIRATPTPPSQPLHSRP